MLPLHCSKDLILANKHAVPFVTVKDYYEYFMMVRVFHICPQKVCFTQVIVRHEWQFLCFLEFQRSVISSSFYDSKSFGSRHREGQNVLCAGGGVCGSIVSRNHDWDKERWGILGLCDLYCVNLLVPRAGASCQKLSSPCSSWTGT